MFVIAGFISWFCMTLVAIVHAYGQHDNKGGVRLCIIGMVTMLAPILLMVFFAGNTLPEAVGWGDDGIFKDMMFLSPVWFLSLLLGAVVAILCVVPMFLTVLKDFAPRAHVSEATVASWTVMLPGIGGMWIYRVEATIASTNSAMLKIYRSDEFAPTEGVAVAPEVLQKSDTSVLQKLYEMGEFMRLEKFKVNSVRSVYDVGNNLQFKGLAPDGIPHPLKLKNIKNVEMYL